MGRFRSRCGATRKFLKSMNARGYLSVELRSETRLVLTGKDSVAPGSAPFDLMVDNLHEARARFTRAGLPVSATEAQPAIDHEIFTVLGPAGHIITVFSSHVSGKPV